MVLLTEDNFPVTFSFLRKVGLELWDDKQRRILPDFVDLFEGHFEKSEEMHDYVVSLSSVFLCSSVYHISSDCANLFGVDIWALFFFSYGIHKRVCLPCPTREVDL